MSTPFVIQVKAQKLIISEKMAAPIVCEFNKFGHCKDGRFCGKRHLNDVCERTSCEISNCPLRHPRPCIYFDIYKECRFGKYCSLAHASKETEKDNLFEEITSLRIEGNCLRSKIEQVEKLHNDKGKEIDDIFSEIKSLKNRNSSIPKEATTPLEAWQIYAVLFVAFWASATLFNQFLMTLVLCVIWGGIAEVVSDYMYRLGRYREKGGKEANSLQLLAEQEAGLVPSLTNMAKLEVSRAFTPHSSPAPRPESRELNEDKEE